LGLTYRCEALLRKRDVHTTVLDERAWLSLFSGILLGFLNLLVEFLGFVGVGHERDERREVGAERRYAFGVDAEKEESLILLS
jgi:hypothetical protein